MYTGKYDILVLGRMFPFENSMEIYKKTRGNMWDAANELQWNIIKGFIQNGEKCISATSYLPVDSWPTHYKDPFVPGKKSTAMGMVHYEYVGFCNIAYLKQFVNRRICDHAVKQWAKTDRKKQKIIICYTRKNALMRAAICAKKIEPSVKIIQVIADLTEHAINPNRGSFYKWYIHAQAKENLRLEKHIDAYVLLTEQMRTRLGIKTPYVVMEGIIPSRPHRNTTPPVATPGLKTVLYTGSMNKKYGILELLEAFSLITESDYRLILCGVGNAEPIIEQYVQKDSRISFLGKIPHEQVLQLQQEATVLVNPRQNNEEFTKYSFPSKTMEYLASGVPLVAYKLDGIPDEYDSYIHYAPDNAPATLAETIKSVAEAPEADRIQWGKSAQSYVLKNKNAQVQTRRILDLVDSLFAQR